MDVLTSVAAKIAEYTVAPIGRQVGYLIYYKNNFDELKDLIEALQGVKERINHAIEEEIRNGKEIEADVRNWLNKVDEITTAANKLSEDPRCAKVGCSRWSFPDLKSRHQLSRNAKKMARNIDQMLAKGMFVQIGYLRPLEVVSMASTTRGSEKLVSRNRMKEDIVLALKDPKVRKIGVYGLSGVGKTTIVKEVARQVSDDKLFDAVVMANVSKTPDLERIQCEIADQLGLHFEEITAIGRANRLHERIKREQTILIILDDIWERLNLEEIGIPLDDAEVLGKGKFERVNHEGCKILLISRKQGTLQNMETQKDFRLEVLNGEETWSLFEVMVGDAIKDANLHSIANQVAAKCGGLPVLIVTVARALKNKDIEYWKDALNQLETVGLETVGSGELNEIVYSALEHSDYQLEDDATKALFLLCAVLETSPSLHSLLKYVIGLDIFKHVSTVQHARNRLGNMIRELKASCLLLEDDKSDQVHMHDVVCDVAISIASKDQYFFVETKDKLKEWPTENFWKRCTAIILNHCNIKKLPEMLDCPNLKLLYLNGADNPSLEMPKFFFLGMENLQVLALMCIKMSVSSTSFSSLADLKTLCLDHCTLEDLTGIGTLKNLEILSLVKSSITKLPSETAQLTNLRMLDLSNSEIEVIPSNIISNLTKLEDLYMGNASIKWGVEYSSNQKTVSLSELRHLPYLTVLQIQILEVSTFPRDLMFENLQSYDIVVGDVLGWPDIHFGTTKTLKLKLNTSIHIEHGIKALIRRAENLYLDEVNGISNVLYHLNGEGLPFLKHLHIQNNTTIQHIITSVDRVVAHALFPRLETLVLCSLSCLDKICHGPLSFVSFINLKIIEVKKCDQLRYILSSSMLKQLHQLLEIEVSECNSLKEIVSAETGDSIEFQWLRSLTLQNLPALHDLYSYELASSKIQEMPFFNAKVKFLNLKILKLSSLNLKMIWDEVGQLSARNLTSLTVDDCVDQTFLFSSSMVGILSNLEKLEVSKCHQMEEILKATAENGINKTDEDLFPNLKTIRISDMEKLKTMWQLHCPPAPDSFGRLRRMEVKNCPKLVSVFSMIKSQLDGDIDGQ